MIMTLDIVKPSKLEVESVVVKSSEGALAPKMLEQIDLHHPYPLPDESDQRWKDLTTQGASEGILAPLIHRPTEVKQSQPSHWKYLLPNRS